MTADRWSTPTSTARRESLALRLATARKASAPASAMMDDPLLLRRSLLTPRRGSTTSGTVPTTAVHEQTAGEEELTGPELRNTIKRDRSAIDGRRSIRAVKIWEAVATCLEEISGVQLEAGRDEGEDPRTGSRFGEEGSGMEGASSKGANSRASTTMTRDAASAYPCPFRKRNPARFNVREHERCARAAFGTVGELRFVISSV